MKVPHFMCGCNMLHCNIETRRGIVFVFEEVFDRFVGRQITKFWEMNC